MVLLALPFIPLLRWFRPSLNKQIQNRFLGFHPQQLPQLDSSIIFFCSSAGEYEQAKPLIDRLQRPDSRNHPVIIFFSESGLTFAKKRNETATMFLAPPDCLPLWHIVFQHTHPKLVFVVRHELWPSFLLLAKLRSTVILINATRNEQTSWISEKFQTLLKTCFDRIYSVDQNSHEDLGKNGLDSIVSGDTKYDRVIERTQANRSHSKQIAILTNSYKKLIVGSAWEPEINATIQALQAIKKAKQNSWQLVLAPHDLSRRIFNLIDNLATEYGLTVAYYSTTPIPCQADIIVIDAIGILAEAYQACDLAMVGGALHNKVHNVLEPASYNLPICFGPNIGSSPEAQKMAAGGFATIVHNAHELKRWWYNNSEHRPDSGQQTLSFVQSLTGATNLIFEQELKHLS